MHSLARRAHNVIYEPRVAAMHQSTSNSHAISRRQALQIGSAGLFGLSLPGLLKAEELARVTRGATAKTKNVNFYWCQGGPPHQDMWDLKPEAPDEIRGEFSPIHSVIPGYQVCELLPRLSKLVDRMTILRG